MFMADQGLRGRRRRRWTGVTSGIILTVVVAACGGSGGGAGTQRAEEETLLSQYPAVQRLVHDDGSDPPAAGLPPTQKGLAEALRSLAKDPEAAAALEYLALITVAGAQNGEPQQYAAGSLGFVTEALDTGTRTSAPTNGYPVYLNTVFQRSPAFQNRAAPQSPLVDASAAGISAIEGDAAAAAGPGGDKVQRTNGTVARSTAAETVLQYEHTFIDTISSTTELGSVLESIGTEEQVVDNELGVPHA